MNKKDKILDKEAIRLMIQSLCQKEQQTMNSLKETKTENPRKRKKYSIEFND